MRLSRAAVGAAVSVLLADAAWAQSPGPAPQPDAGLRPQLQAPLRNPVELNAPAPPVRLQPNLQGPPLQPQTGPGAVVQVRIGAVGVTGAEALAPPQLPPAIAGLAGSTIPLARIEEARLAILRAYRDAGYPFASVNAGLSRRPDAVADVTFAVTEGFVAEVRLEGDIGPAGTQVLRFLNRLIGQRPVSNAALERALLLAQDVPGVTVRGTLRPLATEPGALQLVAQVERRAFSGYLNVDNRGFSLVGPWQGLLVGGLNSVTEFGERTEVSLFGAEGGTQWFAQGAMEAFIGGSGLRMRLYAGAGRTEPSGTLRAIGYRGETQVAGASLSYPIIRSRPLNLHAVGSLELFDGLVETGTTSRDRASRDAIRTARAGFDGQLLDRWLPFLPAATSLASIRLGQGITALGATRNGYPLSGRSGAEDFGFTKLSGEIQRTQPLWSPGEGQMISIQGLAAGQWTDDILPQAEKFYLGGNRLGRGYYAGQVTGDRAWGVAMELQYNIALELAVPPEFGNGRVAAQFYLMRDIGRTLENRPDDANRRLSSWGGGLRTVLGDSLQLDLEAAHRVVRQPDGAAAEPLRETVVLFRGLVKF